MELMQVCTSGTTADVSLAMPTAEQEQQYPIRRNARR